MQGLFQLDQYGVNPTGLAQVSLDAFSPHPVEPQGLNERQISHKCSGLMR